VKLYLLALLIEISCLSFLSARTWTSADGSRTFEGEYRSYDAEKGTVEVLSRGRVMAFSKEKLSQADLQWLEEKTAKPEKDTSEVAGAVDKEELGDSSLNEEGQSALESQVVGKQLLKARLKRFAERRYKKAELEKTPQYYLLYYAASW